MNTIYLFLTDYQKNILLNLQCILENQKEQLSLLRQLVSCSRAGSGDLILEDVLPQPVNTIEELQQLCEKLKQEAFYTNMVIKCYLLLYCM